MHYFKGVIMYAFCKPVLAIQIVLLIGTEGCSNNWHLFDGNCYYFSSTKQTWFHATQACYDEHAWLVDIESDKEQDFLHSKIIQIQGHGSPDLGYWTSGNDLAIEDHWIWGYPGEATITYTAWSPKEPNNHWQDGREEDCLVMSGRYGVDYKWNDQPCDVQDLYICKKEDVQPSVG